MTGVLTVRKTQSNKDDDELVLSLTSTCLVVGEGKEIHRRRRRRRSRAAENLLQKTKRTSWELALTILAKIFITIKLLQKPYWVVELEDEERRQRNKTKTVAARRDERRVGSLWNLPTYVPLPSAEISHEMIMMMMLSLFWHTGKDRRLHLQKLDSQKKSPRCQLQTGCSPQQATQRRHVRSLARSLALLRRSKSAAHVHPAQQTSVSVPLCQPLDTLHSSVRSML